MMASNGVIDDENDPVVKEVNFFFNYLIYYIIFCFIFDEEVKLNARLLERKK